MGSFLHRLRFRLLLLILLVSLPFLGLILYSGLEQRHLAAQSAQENALRLTRLAASNQNARIEGARQLLVALAQLQELRQPDLKTCGAFLAGLQAQYPNYTAINLIDYQGEVICNSVPGAGKISVKDQPYFQQVLQKQAFVVGDYALGPTTQKTILPFAYPVLDSQNRVEEVLLATLDLNWLNDLGPETQLPPEASIFITDQKGNILFRSPDPEKWVGKNLAQSMIVSTILARQEEGTAQTAGLDGSLRLFAFTPLYGEHEPEAFISVGIPTGVAYAEVNRSLARNLTGLGLVTLLALGLSIYAAETTLLHPVNSLLKATRRLAAGDLSARSGAPAGEDELSQLATSFDQMAAALQTHEAQLRRAEARYRALVEQIPAVIYTTRQENESGFQYVSPQLEAMLGYTPLEWTNDSTLWRRRLHPEDAPRVLAALEQARQKGEPFRAEYRLLNRQGRPLWVRDEARPIGEDKNGAGSASQMQGILIDISEQKRIQADLARNTLELERSNRELQDFAYISSHDLQEPLRKIQAFGERLQRKYADALSVEGQDTVDRMVNAAQRMQTLINDLLSYSRVTTRARPFQPVDLGKAVAEALSDLEVSLQESGGQVTVGPLPTVKADPVQMRQLFQNLIANALKFKRPGAPPRVEITSKLLRAGDTQESKIVQISVKDNGIGFEEKYLDRIFQPFQRLHGREEYPGSGIGLAICRKIVQRHDGELSATSTPGDGSTFTFTLKSL